MENGKKPVVIITGSSGLIGRALTRRFARDFQVVGFDVKRPKESPESADHFEVDITSEQSVKQALSEVRNRHGSSIASVVHLAAYYSFSGRPSPKYDEITVEGTRRLLHLLQSGKFDVEQFIFSSTMLVHRPAETDQEISESSPVDPSWAYPESKVHAETVLKLEHKDIPVVNLRIAGVYDDECHSIPIANHIERIYERQMTSHFFPGNPEHGQAYVHLEDLTEAVYLSIQKRSSLPHVTTLLIGEDEAMSFNELETEISCLLYGKAWRVFRIPQPLAKAGAFVQNHLPFTREPFIKPWMIQYSDDHYDLDIHQAKALLGWEPRHSLRETLPKMISDLKRDPETWYRKNKLQYPGPIVRTALKLKRHPWLTASTASAASLLAIGAIGAIKRSPSEEKPTQSS